jgi:hypothetical protein
LAREVVERWPRSHPHLFYGQRDKDDPLADFPERLIELGDRDLASQLLTAAVHDPQIELSYLVDYCCNTNDRGRFAAQLEALIKAPEQGLNPRDLKWLDRLSRLVRDDPEMGRFVTQLAHVAAERFCLPLADKRYYREDPVHPEQTLPLLARVLLRTGDDATLNQVIELVTAGPRRFPIETVQLPALEMLFKPGRSGAAASNQRIIEWLHHLERELATATTAAPQPPADWARPAEIDCNCGLCGELKSYLADPNAPTGRIRAAQDGRDHVTAMIKGHQCDVTYTLDKQTRPFALMLQKTDASHRRRVARYELDQKLLADVQRLLALSQKADDA